MDIIGCHFKKCLISEKKHMVRVCNLYRERIRSIKTVLFFIVRVSLLHESRETVLTSYWTLLSLHSVISSNICSSGHNYFDEGRGFVSVTAS